MMQMRALRLVSTDSETTGSEPKDGALSMFTLMLGDKEDKGSFICPSEWNVKQEISQARR
jgi:hypothetical protein